MRRHRPTEDSGQPTTRDRGDRSVAAAIVTAILLLIGTLALAISMLGQARSLDDNVEVTADIINANVRTLSQAQRELLRLAILIENPMSSADEIELHRGFVGQRMRESQLSYQLQTLRTEELLAEARAYASMWFDDIDARVADLAGTWPAGSADVGDLLDDMADLERGINELVSKGEINRRMQAGEANDNTIRLLANTRVLVGGLVVTFVGFLALVVVAIGAYRRSEAQRAQSRRRLEALHAEAKTLSEVASRTANMVVITDADGRIEWVNAAFTRLTGYARDEVVGERPGALLQGPDTDPATVAMMRERIRNREGFATEVVNYTKSGERYVNQVDVRPVFDDAGRLTNFIAVQSDVTIDRDRADLLRQAKEDAETIAEEKGQFLASMSHEIRTPLNAVIGLTELLLATDLSDQQRQYAQVANNSGSLLLSTVNDILTYSAAEAGRVELDETPFSLRKTVQRVTDLLRTQADDKGIALDVDVDRDVPDDLVGDPTRFQQVLVNLVGNAVKFTERGGVHLRIGADDVTAGRCGLEVVVADTGIGIPNERLERLFQPFTQVDASTTRRYGGTGLGLAIVHRIVELMDGSIDVTSELGAGSRFRVRVPFAVDATARVPEPGATETGGAARLRVLVAEDDAVNQLVATHMLDRLGHDVTVVDNGRDAIEAALTCEYDVILLDVQMPVLDGLAAVSSIRLSLDPDDQPFVVALTANALDGDRERYLAAGMDDYLPKPFRLEQLAAVLAPIEPTDRRTTTA